MCKGHELVYRCGHIDRVSREAQRESDILRYSGATEGRESGARVPEMLPVPGERRDDEERSKKAWSTDARKSLALTSAQMENQRLGDDLLCSMGWRGLSWLFRVL